MKDIIIQSSRFVLRTLSKGDVGDRYLSWVNNIKNTYIDYVGPERSLLDVQSYVATKETDSSTLFLGIFSNESGEHIGNIKYEPIDFINKTTVMGILIGEESWRGKGVAAEVIKASSTWLNIQYGINYIALGVHSNNIEAIRAYQKSGFQIKSTPLIKVTNKETLAMVLSV